MGLMLIDANSIGFAACATPRLIANGEEVQAIFQTLQIIRTLKSHFPDYQNLLVLWDGHARFRFEKHPEYKATRELIPEVAALKTRYQAQKPTIRLMLKLLGVPQAFHSHYEADDLAGFFMRRTEAPVLLITGDRDWLQLMGPNVTWHDPRRFPGKTCRWEKFEEFTGYKTPDHFLISKALVGDNSDNIKGIQGIGPKSAKLILDIYKSFTDLVVKPGGVTEEDVKKYPQLSRYRNRINKAVNACDTLPRYLRNLELMDLCSSDRDDDIKSGIQITRQPKDIEAFKEQCIQLHFHTIVKNIHIWNKVFK